MRRGSNHQIQRTTREEHHVFNPEVNPEMWVQLSVDQHQQTSRLLEEQQCQMNILLDMMQQFQTEMIIVRSDNKRLKSLSDKHNHHTSQPNVERDTHGEREKQQQVHDNPEGSRTQWSNKSRNYNEVESSNFLDQQELKKQNVELQGEFQKIKPPTFDVEAEEVAKAWKINMNKYFQVYEYNNKLKAHLAIYQLWEKATLWWEEVKNVRGIEDQNITWDEFQQYFKDKYLIE